MTIIERPTSCDELVIGHNPKGVRSVGYGIGEVAGDAEKGKQQGPEICPPLGYHGSVGKTDN